MPCSVPLPQLQLGPAAGAVSYLPLAEMDRPRLNQPGPEGFETALNGLFCLGPTGLGCNQARSITFAAMDREPRLRSRSQARQIGANVA